MITIYAEKPDVGTKIAAALDGITLESGKKVGFEELERYEKQVKALRTKNGYLKIKWQGQDVCVTWGYGHMCELKQAWDYNESYRLWQNLPLPYIPEYYELKLSESAGKQFQVIRNCFNKSELVICATDDDREGDLIFDYIYRYMNCRVPFKRALFNKQAKEEYRKAFTFINLVDSEKRMPIIKAGRARSEGDFVVGAGPTVAMTLKSQSRAVLSVGRVQTATLNMVVQRELEIRNFKPKDYYVLKGLFQPENDVLSYIGTHASKKFESKEEAEKVLKRLIDSDRIGIVTSCKRKQYKKGKPYLYSLDSLQMDANKAYGFSLEKTLQIAQNLYENGYTTYPRTDCVHLPEDMVKEMQSVIENLFKNPEYSLYRTIPNINGKDRHYFDNSKVESHYAIVPTTKNAESLTGDERKVYHLIALITICMVYPDAVMGKTELTTEVCGEEFHTSGTSIVEQGFYKVLGNPREKILPAVKEGDRVSSKFAIENKQTKPPERYTDATLLNAMLNCGKTIEDDELKKLMADGPGGKPRGLGRPSSRASIVSTLEKRQYTMKKGKSIIPTELGITMIQKFPVDDLKSAVMTAQWEKRLDDIEKGTDTYESFMQDLENSVRKWTNEIINSKSLERPSCDYKCPACGRPLVQSRWGYECSGNAEKTCGFTFNKEVCKVVLSDEQVRSFFEHGTTGCLKNLKSKQGESFNAALKYNPDTKQTEFDFDVAADENMICPLCGKPLVKTKFGYGCNGYRESGCRFVIGQIAGKRLGDGQIKNLLAGKKVTVNGMKKKNGEKFNAKVKMITSGNDKGKFVFVK